MKVRSKLNLFDLTSIVYLIHCMIKGGTGGAKTNQNGLKFEKDVELANLLKSRGYRLVDNDIGQILYLGEDELGILIKKHGLYRFLNSKGIDYKEYLSRRLLPDNAFLNFKNKTFYILEVKFQSGSGSVDEKLQTCHYKLRQYNKLLSKLNYKVEFSYVLNDWFKDSGYRDTLGYVEEAGCRYYFTELPSSDLGLPK